MNASRHALGLFSCLPLIGYCLMGLLTPGVAVAQKDAEKSKLPSWIWLDSTGDAQKIWLRREFELSNDQVKQAILAGTADNQCEMFVNGRRVAQADDWNEVQSADVARHLKAGKNVLAVAASNEGGPAGVLALLTITLKDGTKLEVVSDATWKVHSEMNTDWRNVGFDDSKWQTARVIGRLGDANLPWTAGVNAESLRSNLAPVTTGEFTPEIAENTQVPQGFKIEKIFHVPRSMGSWVSLTTDPQGRLIACDQGGAGLFLITPGQGSVPTKVEKLPVELSGAQGLLWAFDSLYVMVNGGDKSGLHRLRDTNGDGLVDSDEHSMFVPGGGEHGPHAIVLSPDKKSLYVAAGNHTKLPEAIVGSQMPRNWNEDHLLPRRWDANGHAAGILAPGGWICNVDESGKQFKMFSMGYRNQYDIAFNTDGELFTYDADMEWDFGSPWYRPTRVCHATSGSEFGWRSGTGKWPEYYEDSLPAAVDIGPGSPTGIVFGTGAKFPARYQKALFILDWTYSTIYSIDLTPTGSSYQGKKSDFVTGTPLPVTDAVVGNDGAFYFAVGGRGTQSALYRVTYVGSESTAPVSGHDTVGADARALRQRLESYHGKAGGDIDFIISQLGHEDRFIRFAARVALENQPIDAWRSKALAQSQPTATINAMIALAHQGKPADQDAILDRLATLKMENLSSSDQLAWLRAFQLAFTRLGEPSDAWRKKLTARFDAHYPASSYPLNAELVQLLVYLQSPSVIAKTLDIMDKLGPEPKPDWGYLIERNAGYGGTVGKMLADMPPSRGIHFAFMLRNVKSGWTLDQRKKYFQFFIDAAQHPGGNSYGKFLMQFREDALESCSQAEKIILAPLAGRSLVSAPILSKPAEGPGRKWTSAEALAALGTSLEKRDFKKGENLYHATSCSKCHRMAGEGGAIGPDLSTAAKKFSLPDLIDAIIEPSKVISDQYGSHQVVTSSGQVIVGRAVEIGNEYYVYTIDTDAKPIILAKDDVDEIKPSTISQMPEGLIDALNPEELKDLIAYMLASGDPRAKIYR